MGKIYNRLFDKKGAGFLNGLLIVCAAMGIGTICITYNDYKKQDYQINDIEQNNISSIITVEDTIGALANSGGYTYKTDISLGEIGNAYLTEETISKELAIYSGMVSYSNGETYGVRVTIMNGEEVSFGFSGTETLPMTFIQYLKDAALKMYSYRF